MRGGSFRPFENCQNVQAPCPVFIRERLERLKRLEQLELAALLRRLERSNAVERLERFERACGPTARHQLIENRGASIRDHTFRES